MRIIDTIKKTLCGIVRQSGNLLIAVMVVVAFALSMCLILVIADDSGVWTRQLGAENKSEVIKLIGLGMGGALAAIGTVLLNRRADAMASSAAAMAQNNELIEKGHINERFKVAMESLGYAVASVRIAAFHQFYNLAKGSSDKDFVKSIFDILCSHLRQITSDDDYRNGKGRDKPTEECQSLLDVLFKNSQNIFSGLNAQLRGVYLVGADFGDANLQGAVFNGANLRGANFWKAKLERVFFVNAKLQKANFTVAEAERAYFGYADVEGAVFQFTGLRMASFHEDVKNLDKAAFSYITIEGNPFPAWFKKETHYTVMRDVPYD